MKTISQIYNSLRLKEKSVRQIVDECISEIKNNERKFNDKLGVNEDINAILGFMDEEFINSQIVNAENMLSEDRSTRLTGVPIVLKDNILVQGEKVSAGSKMLENYVATYSSSVVDKLREAGAIIIARANMDEFAMGSSTESCAYGIVRNPIDTSRVPGGSSGGSAAVVAYGGAPIALGSDTGGSIRLPAAFTNLVGFKPTYGSISRYGLIAMGSSLDQIGPFANTVSDAEDVFDIISFYDKNDSTSIPKEFRNEKFSLKKRIGIPKILSGEGMRKAIDPAILENFDKQINDLKDIGYEIIEVDIPNLDKALAIYYVICPAEVSSNMGRYDGVRYGLSVPGANTVDNFSNSRTSGLGDEVRRRILLGTYILSAGYFDAFYNKAVIAREILKKEFEKVFEEVDAIATPTSSMFPWKFGEKSDPLSMYLADIFTVPANIIGAPAISVPTTKRSEVNANNLPMSIHLVSGPFEDKKLFKIAKDIEELVNK